MTMNGFEEITADRLGGNAFDMIGREWMLVTAGDAERCNTMTASWGGLGIMWGKPAATVYIRPQRYTREFIEREGRLTLAFMDERWRAALNWCGSHSGRDGDKMAACGLTPSMTPDGVPFPEQARVLLQCRVKYSQRMVPEGFADPATIDRWYPARDFHDMYICEVERVFVRK